MSRVFRALLLGTPDVLEIGVGTGHNLDRYPYAAHVVGIDHSGTMLGLARARARQLGRDVDLQLSDAQCAEFTSESFDTVVVTLVLCAVPDDRQAIGEVARVLRPGGRRVWLEHVQSPLAPVRWVQRRHVYYSLVDGVGQLLDVCDLFIAGG